MKYSGIDLHSNNCVVAVIDEGDRVLYRKRLPNELSLIIAALARHQEELHSVVVESTYNWYWLVDGLREAGFDVRLANTAQIKQYEGLKHCDDGDDAVHLAHLMRLGVLAQGYIYPKAQRAVRDLLRKRSQLVRQRTANVLAIENLVARNSGRLINGNQVKRLTEEELVRLEPDSARRLALQANVAVMDALNEQIERIEAAIKAQMSSHAQVQSLKSVPGIGQVLALTIALETGSIERFAEVGHFASYSRCVDSRRLSNGKKKGEGNAKCGNKYLAWAFVEAANFAVRYSAQAKRFYQRKKAKTNNVVAIKAVAHKLARACYYVMRDRVPFDPGRCFS
jgi:transposase